MVDMCGWFELGSNKGNVVVGMGKNVGMWWSYGESCQVVGGMCRVVQSCQWKLLEAVGLVRSFSMGPISWTTLVLKGL